MPDDTQPSQPSAPVSTPAPAPRTKPMWQVLVEGLVDLALIAMICAFVLKGKIDATIGTAIACAVGGVRIADLFRSGGGGGPPAGGLGGLTGLLVAAGTAAVHALAPLARAGRGALAVVALAALAASPLALASCSGVQVTGTAGGTVTTSPGGDWVASVEIGIQITRRALAPIQAALDARPEIAAPTRATIDRVFQVGAHALDLADTALTTYAQSRTETARCAAHLYTERALTALLQGLALARDAGAAIPPEVDAALGGLGVVNDVLFPGCGGPAAPGGASQARVQATLARPRR